MVSKMPLEIEPLQQVQRMSKGYSKEKSKVKQKRSINNSYSIKMALRMKMNSTICAICVNSIGWQVFFLFCLIRPLCDHFIS